MAERKLKSHGGTLWSLNDPDKNLRVDIDFAGMDQEEIERAIEAAGKLLDNAEPAPRNRKQRRARKYYPNAF